MWTWLTDLIIGKRDWELISEKRFQSTQLHIFNELSKNPRGYEMSYHPDDLYQILVLIFKCKLTGKVKIEKIRF